MTNKEMTAYINAQLQNMRQYLMKEIREQVQQEYFHLLSQFHMPLYPLPHSRDDSCFISRHVTENPQVILFIISKLLQGILLINIYFI